MGEAQQASKLDAACTWPDSTFVAFPEQYGVSRKRPREGLRPAWAVSLSGDEAAPTARNLPYSARAGNREGSKPSISISAAFPTWIASR